MGTGVQPRVWVRSPRPGGLSRGAASAVLAWFLRQAPPPRVTGLSRLALDFPGLRTRSLVSQNLPRAGQTGEAGHPSGEASCPLDKCETGKDSSRTQDVAFDSLSPRTEPPPADGAATPRCSRGRSQLLPPAAPHRQQAAWLITLPVPREATEVSPTLQVVHFQTRARGTRGSLAWGSQTRPPCGTRRAQTAAGSCRAMLAASPRPL